MMYYFTPVQQICVLVFMVCGVALLGMFSTLADIVYDDYMDELEEEILVSGGADCEALLDRFEAEYPYKSHNTVFTRLVGVDFDFEDEDEEV